MGVWPLNEAGGQDGAEDRTRGEQRNVSRPRLRAARHLMQPQSASQGMAEPPLGRWRRWLTGVPDRLAGVKA